MDILEGLISTIDSPKPRLILIRIYSKISELQRSAIMHEAIHNFKAKKEKENYLRKYANANVTMRPKLLSLYM